MCQAFELVKSTLEQWLPGHQTSLPPIVLHLTDGESTDGDPSDLGRQIGSYSTQDGQVLLLNCHVSSRHRAKVEYPNDESNLPDDFAKMLFRISSALCRSSFAAPANRSVSRFEMGRGAVRVQWRPSGGGAVLRHWNPTGESAMTEATSRLKGERVRHA